MFPKRLPWALLALAISACSAASPASTPASLTPTRAILPTDNISRAVSPSSPKQIDLAEDLYLRQIGEGTFVVTHTFPWNSNSLLVEMADRSWVLAGSPNTPEATQLLLDWLEEQGADDPIVATHMVAINTGYHADNLAGNQALLAAGIPVYGSEQTANLIAERGEDVRRAMLEAIGENRLAAYQAQLSMAYLPPDHRFKAEDGLMLSFGGEQVRVIYPGPSQAPDKLAVYFPARKLLFGSCMVVGMEKLGNTADANLQHWPEAVRQLQSLAVDVVVPGHGERLDPQLLQHTLDLLAAAP